MFMPVLELRTRTNVGKNYKGLWREKILFSGADWQHAPRKAHATSPPVRSREQDFLFMRKLISHQTDTGERTNSEKLLREKIDKEIQRGGSWMRDIEVNMWTLVSVMDRLAVLEEYYDLSREIGNSLLSERKIIQEMKEESHPKIYKPKKRRTAARSR